VVANLMKNNENRLNTCRSGRRGGGSNPLTPTNRSRDQSGAPLRACGMSSSRGSRTCSSPSSAFWPPMTLVWRATAAARSARRRRSHLLWACGRWRRAPEERDRSQTQFCSRGMPAASSNRVLEERLAEIAKSGASLDTVRFFPSLAILTSARARSHCLAASGVPPRLGAPSASSCGSTLKWVISRC